MKRVFSICISLLMALFLGTIAAGWNQAVAVADSKPDLIVQNISISPAEPAIGDTVTITVTVKNQGTAGAVTSQVVCYVDTSILDTEPISSLAPGTMATASFTWQAQSGSHVIKAVADASSSITESDETNNTTTYSLTTLAPDLIVQSISWEPASPSKGDSIIFSVIVRNQGNSKSRTTRVNFYIDGVSKGYEDVFPVDPGSATTKTFNWIAQAGQHDLKAVVDETHQVVESNETNNEYTCTYSTLPPDLIVADIAWSPESPSKYDEVTFTVTVKNQGTGRSGACQLAYYLDGNYQSLLQVDALEAGTSENITFTWMALSDLSEIKAVVDFNNSISESDDANNEKTSAFLILRPDLVVSDITWSPLDAGVGDTVTITATIYNQGVGRAGKFRVGCFISGQYAGFVDINQLEVEAEADAIFHWTAVNGIHPVNIVVDNDNLLVEINEDNNKATTSIPIEPPDIYIPSIAWSPEHPSIGDTVTFSINLTNQGGGKADSFYVAYYLDDVFVSAGFVSGILADSSVNTTFTWQAQNGRHTFGAFADYNKTITEKNENNNEKTVTVAPHMPDLAIGTITWSPADMPPGEEVKFSITIENIGSLGAGPSRIAYYVDGVIAGFTDMDNLNAGSKITDHFLWEVASGFHTIEVVADSSDRVTEVDEDNNVKIISIPPPDLIVSNVNWSPSQASIGDNVTFTVTVKNQGGSRSLNSRVDCYVNDLLIGFNNVPPIDPSGSATSRFVWAAEKGSHAIRIVADSSDQVTEVDETNNEMKTSYATSTPDLVIEGISWLMEEPLLDDEVVFIVTIRNQGGDASGPCQLAFTINDSPAITEDVKFIPAGESGTVVITADLSAGPHTVEASVDSLDEVIELDETNNEKTLAFSTVAPDLIVKMISWSPRDAAPGDKVTISVRVENQGRDRAEKSRLSLGINGTTVDSVEIGEMDVGEVVTKEFAWTAVTGLQEISISADIDGLLLESNEANNTGTRTITIADEKKSVAEPIPLSAGPSGDKGFMGEWWWLFLLVALIFGGTAFVSAYRALKKEK
jgi:uncharacterized repeat protein (TIGR01451 family)